MKKNHFRTGSFKILFSFILKNIFKNFQIFFLGKRRNVWYFDHTILFIRRQVDTMNLAIRIFDFFKLSYCGRDHSRESTPLIFFMGIPPLFFFLPWPVSYIVLNSMLATLFARLSNKLYKDLILRGTSQYKLIGLK